jgi:hypothetical protein
MSDNGTMKMIYRNYRGEVSERTIAPNRIVYGTTDWHPEPGWLLEAVDVEKKATREFALADCDFRMVPAQPAQGEAVAPWRMALENAAQMAEQGILSMDGGQAASEIRSLAPDRYSPPDSAGELDALGQAALDVLAERARQISAEGWTPEHDDQHDNGEIAKAAGCYALASSYYHIDPYAAVLSVWPWERASLKPSDPRRDLVKAGALILAEIERLDRAALRAKGVR